MIILSLLLNCIFCTTPRQLPDFPYQVNTPDKTFTMPKELEEISGLSVSKDGKSLVAIQDENGIIFLVDKNTGKIVKETKFWEDGDYEGVEVVGEDIYVVKSSGTIYRMAKNGEDVEKFNFFLDAENDVEGLAYDAKNNRLLLACKAKAGKDSKMKKGIYAFDLNKKTLVNEPVYVISQEDVQQYLSKTPVFEEKEKLLEMFGAATNEFSFAPSSIAVHPRTGHIYLLSSVGKVLFVMDSAGKILHIEKLKKKVHAQPEGICFDADGTMYISNEAKDGELGKIYVFKMK